MSNLHEFMGSVFEKMARNYIFENVGTEKIPAFVTDVIEYQKSVSVGKDIKSVEIDLFGLDGKDYVLAGECKFRTGKFDRDDFEIFMDKLKYLPSENLKVMLFSLSSFTDYVGRIQRTVCWLICHKCMNDERPPKCMFP